MAFDPSASEQELMQLTNRFRTDPTHEFSRLIASSSPRKAHDANVDFSLSFFNSNVAIVGAELALLTSVPPVAWDEIGQQAARDYLPYMIAAKTTSHTLNGTYQQRIQRYNFDFSKGGTARENLFLNAFSPVHTHASYVLEWGSGPNGLQDPGHRRNLMNPAIKTAGMAFAAVTYEPSTGFGPNVNAQELIGLGATPPMITGAVFQDRNTSGWYDAGEGLSGVQFTFEGPAGRFVTNGFTAGGYNVALPPGTYSAVASGGGMRFPISIPGVVVGSQNVWLNFLYDPSAVPPDSRESNNSIGTATVLTGSDQLISNGTIHRGDVDYFRFPATTSGTLRAELRFAHSNGNLDLRVLDASGNLLARSNTTSDVESINLEIRSGTDHYLVVESPDGSIGGPYMLQLSAPAAQPAIARADSASTALGASAILIDVLSNDSDPDGSLAAASLSLATSGRGTVDITPERTLRYTPPAGFTGVDRFTYRITDQQGLTSLAASVQVMVLDFGRSLPFLSPGLAMDVNHDGAITAMDALLVINEINTRGARTLPTTMSPSMREMFGFVDVNANGSVEPRDVLLIINHLNTNGAGESESVSPSLAVESDTAFVSQTLLHDAWVAAQLGGQLDESQLRKRRGQAVAELYPS